jgi:hypothetical protein
MAVLLLLDIDLENPPNKFDLLSEESEEEYYHDDCSDLEIGIARFCYRYFRGLTVILGDEQIRVDSWSEIWLLIVYTLYYTIPSLYNREKFGFPLFSGGDITITEYNEGQAKFRFNNYSLQPTLCGSGEFDPSDLSRELIAMATRIVSLSVEVGYVDSEEAKDFLSELVATRRV